LTDKLQDDFFVFYGDYGDGLFDMQSMLNYHRSHHADATLFVHPNDHPYDSDIVDLNTDGSVRQFPAQAS